jgi:hypothetical protein
MTDDLKAAAYAICGPWRGCPLKNGACTRPEGCLYLPEAGAVLDALMARGWRGPAADSYVVPRRAYSR